MISLQGFDQVPEHFPWHLIGTERAKDKRDKRANTAGAPAASADAEPKLKKAKTRKPRLQSVNKMLGDIAGNAMCLPDLAKFLYTGHLASNDATLWERPFDPNVLDSLRKPDDHHSSTFLVSFDPWEHDFKTVRRSLAVLELHGGSADDDPAALELDEINFEVGEPDGVDAS